MKSAPDKFTIVITEKDRQAAGPFRDNHNCLVATALKRRGHKKVSEHVEHVTICKRQYSHAICGNEELHRLTDNYVAPFYGPGVVGKKIVFTLIK